MKTALLCVLFISATLAEYTSYEGYTTYSVTPATEEEAILLKGFSENEEYDFWSPVRALNHPVSVMVPPELKESFTNILDQNNIQFSVLIENFETVVKEERLHQSRAPRVEKGRINFEAYQRYDAILDYLDQLNSSYSDIVSVETYGSSYEGRDLRVIRIGTDNLTSSKPTILIEGGIHAREWIAPAVVLYIIQELVENTNNSYLIENANWIIVPVSNPDGYEFSHTNTRMWRKTRRIGSVCNGVDGNRNFDYQWGGPGTSTSQCSEIFIGPSPFSESECLGLANLALEAENVALYLAIHSYGNWILYPWGYTMEPPDNNDELSAIGHAAADAISSLFGTEYVVGNSAGLLYFAAGASDDWMKAVANISLSYTVELPGGGSQGFDLPPARIANVVAETWLGILSFYESVVNTK